MSAGYRSVIGGRLHGVAGPCEIMGIFDRDARRGHQRDGDDDAGQGIRR